MHGFGAVIGALMGFGAAVWPNLMDIIKSRGDHKRELESKDQEIEALKSGIELARTQNDTITTLQAQNEQLQLQALDNSKDCGIVDVLRSTVRPILTYGFFILFATVKILTIWHAYTVEHASTLNIQPLVWDEDSESLFAAVISFWFGSRSVSAAYEQRKKPKTDVVNSLGGHNNGLQVRD